jgi:hypothetical protein
MYSGLTYVESNRTKEVGKFTGKHFFFQFLNFVLFFFEHNFQFFPFKNKKKYYSYMIYNNKRDLLLYW